MSAIGSLFCDTINWPQGPPYVHSTAYRQSGRDGNGHILGPQYADPTILRSEHFIASMTDEAALLDAAAAVCGAVQDVVEDVAGGGPVSTPDVFVESYKVVKCGAVFSALGNFHCILEFTVYMPLGS